jgi:hypothetical protein
MKERHGAIVYIDTKYLLELLDMKGGTIHKVYQPEGYMFPDPDYFAVLVEHPDLPVVPHGESAQVIRPELTITYDESGYPVKTVWSYPPHKIQ